MNSPPSPHRYRLHRAGIRNVWQYDEQEFAFGDGRLLLRGKNGAGKSKALEMLLPYLLDGDARALDATGTGRTTLLWLLLDGFERTNRLGYLWVEFARTDEVGTHQYLTLGAAVRASQSTRTAKPFFFTTPLRVGEELHLTPAGQPLPVDQLKSLVGPQNVTDRAVEHRARVARELFGLTDPARYRNLLHLLHRLRRPTIGDRIDSGGLVSVLAETLPALDDEIVDNVARNLDDLDAVRADLGRLERTDQALRTFLTDYRGYLHGALRRRAGEAAGELEQLARYRKAAGDAAARSAALREHEAELGARVETLEGERADAETDLAALHASAGYRGLKELAEKRATVTALHSAATTAFKSLRQAHTNQEEAGRRLTAEAGRLGGELVDLSTTHGELVREAERSGLDPVHLGEPVAADATVAAPATTAELTSPEGDFHLVRHSQVPAVDTEACVSALRVWDARLDAAQPVIRNRSRSVTELGALIEKSERAQREAREADATRERLEEQTDLARSRVERRRQEAAREGEAYADSARAWTERLRSLTGLPLDALDALVTHDPADGALPARTPDDLADAARSAVDPWLAELSEQHVALAVTFRELTAERDRLRGEREEWERRTDPEPPPPPHRSAPRVPGTGAPLYRLVDFADGLAPEARAGLEAALEASGLLDAWVHADGTVRDPATRDTLLVPGAPAAEPTLARALRPVAAPDSGVGVEQVRRVLEAVALVGDRAGYSGSSDGSHTVLGTDGSWKLGIARGRHTKPAAEYVGAEVRAETRRRTLAELDRQLAVVEDESARSEHGLRVLTEHRDQVADALLRPPPARGLTDAWARTVEAERAADSLYGQAAAAAREAEQARTRAVAARRETEATASAHGLPADPTALDTVRLALRGLGQGTEQLRRRIRAVVKTADGHGAGRTEYERASAARRDAESDHTGALDRLDTARRTVQALEEALGATEQEIIAREAEAQRRLDAVGRQLPHVRQDMADLHDERVRAEEDEKGRRDALVTQEAAALERGRRLRTALAQPGVLKGAGLGADEDGHDGEGLKFWDPIHADARERAQALSLLVDAVVHRLDAERRDVSDTTLLNRHTDLRDQLSGGYDATIEEHDGIKLCRLVDDHGPHDVALVGARIAAQAAEARDRLTEREREVFQRFLTGELGDHLSSQVLAASALVAALNATLSTVRTSHGLGVTLDWRLADGVEADVKAAVDLLRSPSGLRTREQSEQLRDVLQRRIEDARRADPAAGYASHLRTALDYRDWFTFTPWVVNDAAPGNRRKLSGRTGMSQGEQRVLSYLVLFAASAAHFTSLAESAPHAPRLILLDDAFAKVDEPTHARLGRILVELDLDFVLTSERLVGNWPDVPSLHIYECLRDPHVRGVATLHYTWNGRQRRLVSV
ncbi:TIGR02680 family protein [Streptomyces sp. ID01-12c]|uniref:TIGR02680 family protein n=1 Tax=Streptomyces caniscabiei TaxID=2746961 RepID=UPI00177F1F14|nr:TIGR02680 family protein [Streptomyces caniscabiei]MBD9703206.1 TIGR02680 family protein [Streptomyces caniscabiei]MDX3732840.1 TIGR02680 family protein [Streptomyces caniscabiei]